MKTFVNKKEAAAIKKNFKELTKKGVAVMKAYLLVGKKFKRSERTVRNWVRGK